MINVPIAHVGGIPVEETVASLGPALLVAFGVAWANLRARLRRVGSRATALASDDTLDDPPFQPLDALDLEPDVGEVIEGVSYEVVGAEAHAERVEHSL